MPTIIDEFVMTLGWDTTQWKAGQAQIEINLTALRGNVDKTASEMEVRGKQAAQFFAQVKNEALGLMGVLLGGKGIEAFTRDAVSGLSQLGREAQNVGVSVKDLAAFNNMIERNGGTAAAATASLKGYADAIEAYRIRGDTKVLPFLGVLEATPQDDPLAVYMKFVKFVQDHKNDLNGTSLIRQEGMGLGYDEGLINATIQMGSLAKATQEFHRSLELGVPNEDMTRRMQELSHDWSELRQAADNAANTLLYKVEPALDAVVQWGTKEIQQHPEVVEAIGAIAGALTTLSLVRISASVIGLTGLASSLRGLIGLATRFNALFATLLLSGDTPQTPVSPEQEAENRRKAEEEAARINREQGYTGNFWHDLFVRHDRFGPPAGVTQEAPPAAPTDASKPSWWQWLKSFVVAPAEAEEPPGGPRGVPQAPPRRPAAASSSGPPMTGTAPSGVSLGGRSDVPEVSSLPLPESAGSYGTRANNPLNLDFAPGQGAVGKFTYMDRQEGRHTMGVFETPAAGIAAGYRQLLRYQDDLHLHTLRQILGRWAGNSYAEKAAKELGIGIDQPVNLHDPELARRVMANMFQHENRGTLSDADIRAGIQQYSRAASPPQTAPSSVTPPAPETPVASTTPTPGAGAPTDQPTPAPQGITPAIPVPPVPTAPTPAAVPPVLVPQAPGSAADQARAAAVQSDVAAIRAGAQRALQGAQPTATAPAPGQPAPPPPASVPAQQFPTPPIPPAIPPPPPSVSHTSSTSNSHVAISSLNVHTQATDAKGISKDIGIALQDAIVAQSNRGLA